MKTLSPIGRHMVLAAAVAVAVLSGRSFAQDGRTTMRPGEEIGRASCRERVYVLV